VSYEQPEPRLDESELTCITRTLVAAVLALLGAAWLAVHGALLVAVPLTISVTFVVCWLVHSNVGHGKASMRLGEAEVTVEWSHTDERGGGTHERRGPSETGDVAPHSDVDT
jgi:hypothetical protein